MSDFLSIIQSSDVVKNFQSFLIILSACGIGVEFVPFVKINPISMIVSFIGKNLNKDIDQKVDEIGKRIDKIKDDVDDLRAEMGKDKAISLRYRILRFGDDLIRGKMTKEHFDQILLDITEYEDYCETHELFRNNIILSTTKFILDEYDRCLREDDFLK